MKVRRLFVIMAVSGLLNGLTPMIGSAQESAQMGSYLVRLKEQANVTAISKMSDLSQRRWYLYSALRSTADRTQAPLRDLLQREQKLGRVESVTPLWIDNIVAFRGQAAVANAIAGRAEVERVTVDEVVTVKPTPPGSSTALWNLLKVRASSAGGVWDQGFSGAGITVGSIDTGVDFNHPAIEPDFRGRPAPGEARFQYNWFDFFGTSRYPIDLNGHGTHVMGTITGGDGPGPFTPDIGLAYNAKWIAARAFDENGNGTTLNVLLASQFMQAPTNLNGLNPRPDLAPDVINNSWGAGNGDGLCRPWYQLMIRNWRLANIMPVFSVGDNTGHSPGDMGIASIPELEQSASYSTGATDSNDVKAAFSPEVKTTDSCPLQSKDQVRPNILAPGVDIYSSVPQGAGPSALYVSKSGTSMAAAHVSGASALMLEAAGGAGSITTNDYKLDGHLNASATTTVTGCTLTCRRLDVFAAVQRVRKDGILQGRVTYMDGLTERGLANAKISAFPASGLARITYSDANGNYILRKLDGVYTVEVRGPVTVVGGNVIGWIRQRITGVTIGSKDTVVRNFQMQRAPNRPLDGDVLRYASGDAAAGVTVRLEGTPLTATTNSVGHFTFSAVPDPSIPDPALGDSTTDYELVTDGDRCSDLKRQSIIINGSLMTNDLPNTLQIVRALRRDTFGYYCVEKPIDYIAGTSPLNLRGDDEFGEVAIPFTFPFYGIARNSVFISTNGFARFDSGSSEFGNTGLPNAVSPNAAAYPFWDDLTMDSRSSILTTTTADSFVVEWRRMTFAPGFFDRITFTMTLHRNGDIEFQYKQVDNATRPKGTSATIGLENHKGDDAFQYSNAEAIVQTGKSILFSPALQVGVVRGTVRGLSAEAVPFARVTAISETDSVPRTVTADAAGFYSHNLRADSYSFRASAFHYDSQTIPGVSVTAGNQPACFPASLCPRDFSLFRQPGYTVSGVVTDTATGGKIYGVIVSLNHPNIPDVFADSQGNYVFSDIPAGAYRLGVGGTNRCVLVTSKTITVTTNTVENIGTSLKRDSFGYSCRDESPISTAHESGVLTTTALNGDDVWVDMALPFLFPLYGNLATRAFISSNGFMRFDAGSAQFSNVIIPNTTAPNFVVMPFWDDLTMDGGSRVQTHTDTDGFFSVEWIDMVPNSDPDTRVTFEVILHPSGNFEYQYRVVDPDKANGYTASIGFEDRTGVRGFSYSFDEASVASGRRVRFLIDGSEVLGGSGPGGGGGGPGGGGGGSFVPSGVAGLVLRSGTSSPLPGATISRCGGCVTGTVTSLADGTYSLPLPAGTYSITASKFGSIPQTKSVTVGSTFVRLDFDLAPAPLYKLSGVIKDQFGVPVPGIEISVRELAALKASSIYADNAGKYSVILPQADYEVKLPGRCVVSTVPASPIAVALTGPVVRDITANLLADTYGYTCVDKLGSYVAGTVPIFLPGPGTKLFAGAAPLGPVYSPRIDGVGDDTSIPVPLPFDIPLYGKARKVAFVNVDGFVRFDNGVGGLDGPTLNVLNNPAFIVDGAEIYVGLVGIDRFVIEWRGVRLGDSANRVNVEVILNNNGFIDYVYRPGSDQATSAAKIGMEDGCAGGAVLTYAASVLNSVRSGQGILLRPPTAALPGYVAC